MSGIEKPGHLNGLLYCIRRIDDVNRIVYRIEGEDCRIAQCRWHYEG
ncbi:MAG: type II toxin-antitoxin system YoeB family toxin [Desulfovibrio sp.]|nr:type II toxin-antitoxin system YoeB family toxin [Desulfovibrio sp.]